MDQMLMFIIYWLKVAFCQKKEKYLLVFYMDYNNIMNN